MSPRLRIPGGHRPRIALAATLLAVGAVPMAGAGAQAVTDTTLALERGATVEVNGSALEVTVTVGPDGTMRVRGGDSARGGVHVSGDRRAVLVRASGNRRADRVTITVPRGTTVLARTTVGDLTVRGTGGDVEANTITGDVRIEEADRVRVSTVSGEVWVQGVRDGARVATTSGDVQLVGVSGDVEVTATSGNLTMREVASRRLDVQLVSGDLAWEGALVDGGRYAFSTHSGDLRLALPRAARATLDVRTYSGELDAGPFPLTLMPPPADAPRDRGHTQRYTLGSGDGARISVTTFSGDITFRTLDGTPRRD
jgi:hypothetical protein